MVRGCEHAQHDRSLGDEPALAPDDVALADGTEGRDARVVAIGDANRRTGQGDGLNCR